MTRSATNGAANNGAQAPLPLRPTAEEQLDVSTLEHWLWDAACEIRGATDAPKFMDFILPLVFFKRLSDVFDDEFAAFVTQSGSGEVARADIVRSQPTTPMRSGPGASPSCASSFPTPTTGAPCAPIRRIGVWVSLSPSTALWRKGLQ